MLSILRVSGAWFQLVVVLTVSFAELRKGSGGEPLSPEAVDFNLDGRVDAEDLLSLLEREGAIIGQEKYSVVHDLQSDGSIDSEDLLLFLYGWKGVAPRPDPISTQEFLERTGLNNLSGETWRFKCLTGGVEDCLGERRTLTGGALTEINGRTVLPIIWGSESGGPWDILYLTMDGDLGFMGVEKAGRPDQLPGITLPPQTIGISGMIPWTTSETVYPGSAVAGNGTASLTYGLGKGGDNIVEGCKSVIKTLLFGRSYNLPDITSGMGVAFGDIDGDGEGEVVVGEDDGKLRIYEVELLSTNCVVNSVAEIEDNFGRPISIALGDVNRDGATDMIVGNRGAPNRLFLSTGTGNPFSDVAGIDVSGASDETCSVALADLDGDGFLDLVEGCTDAPTRVYLNTRSENPFGGVTGTILTNTALGTVSVAVGDADGDGDQDIVEGNFNETNRLYLNNGTSQPFFLVGGFQFEGEARRTRDIELGDVDLDGDLDLVEASSDRPVRFYANNGTTTPFAGVTGRDLKPFPSDPQGGGSLALALGNFQPYDAYPELIAIRPVEERHYLYDNLVWDESSSRFVYETLGGLHAFTTTGYGNRYDVAGFDQDGDGDMDVVTTGFDSANRRIAYFRNLAQEDGSWFPCAVSHPSSTKGSSPPQGSLIQVSGEGTLGEPGGLEARARWNLYFDQDGLQFIQLCWEFMGQKKCLSFGRIPGATGEEPPDDCHCGPDMCLFETSDIGGLQGAYATMDRDYCYLGSLPIGDSADGFRVLSAPTRTDLYVLLRILEGSGAGIRIYRGSPTPANLVVDELLDNHYGESFYDVPAGVMYWIELYSVGNPVVYELRALTLDF